MSYWRRRSLLKQDPNPEKPQLIIFRENETVGHLSDLHPYSQYIFNIRVFNGKGDGPTSSDQQFTTPEGGIVYIFCTHKPMHFSNSCQNQSVEFLLWIVFLFLDKVPGPPTELKIKNLDLDSLIVEWASPLEDNGHLTGYRLKYQPSKSQVENEPVIYLS